MTQNRPQTQLLPKFWQCRNYINAALIIQSTQTVAKNYASFVYLTLHSGKEVCHESMWKNAVHHPRINEIKYQYVWRLRQVISKAKRTEDLRPNSGLRSRPYLSGNKSKRPRNPRPKILLGLRSLFVLWSLQKAIKYVGLARYDVPWPMVVYHLVNFAACY